MATHNGSRNQENRWDPYPAPSAEHVCLTLPPIPPLMWLKLFFSIHSAQSCMLIQAGQLLCPYLCTHAPTVGVCPACPSLCLLTVNTRSFLFLWPIDCIALLICMLLCSKHWTVYIYSNKYKENWLIASKQYPNLFSAPLWSPNIKLWNCFPFQSLHLWHVLILSSCNMSM